MDTNEKTSHMYVKSLEEGGGGGNGATVLSGHYCEECNFLEITNANSVRFTRKVSNESVAVVNHRAFLDKHMYKLLPISKLNK